MTYVDGFVVAVPRAKIEAGIESAGYQLWRVKKAAPDAVAEETA